MPRKKKEEPAKSASPQKTKTARTKAAASKKPRAVKAAAPSADKPKRAPRVPKSPVKAQSPMAPVRSRLPRKGETQMVAFVRDPHCIFTYWEVTPESVEEVKRDLMEEYAKSSMVLRVYRADASGGMVLVREIQVGPKEMNRYVEIDGNGSYQVEVAQKAPSGKLFVFARSNRVGVGAWAATAGGPGPNADLLEGEVPNAFIDHGLGDEDTEFVESRVPGGVSSAEAYRREILRKKMDRYAASRIQ